MVLQVAGVGDPKAFLAKSLAALSSQQPGRLPTIIGGLQQQVAFKPTWWRESFKTQTNLCLFQPQVFLQQYLQAAGVTIQWELVQLPVETFGEATACGTWNAISFETFLLFYQLWWLDNMAIGQARLPLVKEVDVIMRKPNQWRKQPVCNVETT